MTATVRVAPAHPTARRSQSTRPATRLDRPRPGYVVEVQQGDPDSLLSWMERAIRVRKQAPEFGWGQCTVLESGHPSVLAHRCEWLDGTVLAIHNFGPEDAKVRLGADVDSTVPRRSSRTSGPPISAWVIA